MTGIMLTGIALFHTLAGTKALIIALVVILAIIFGLSLYGVGSSTPPYDPKASAFAWLVWVKR